ncbi:hydroxymethylbilane synthase [Desulforudis sp. 1088]|uniref:hydroxymethylbilane synthase n=1 Tax=unclassified Candidatus Desulforudis TaxID=2635950 RepID=UPI0034857352
MVKEIVVGTRSSPLALEQTNLVIRMLQEKFPEVRFHKRLIKTTGDNILDTALAKIGDKGLFTKEIELALLDGTADIAVHSMKDVPTGLPKGLTIGAITAREYPGDVLVSRDGTGLDALPEGARLGTSSLRRAAQLLAYRPDFRVIPVRGNVQTRLRKLDEDRLDALILAWAGLHRLGLDGRITERIPFAVCLPAVGQGALGIEIREKDEEVLRMVSAINDPETSAAVRAERALLRRLEGGCQVPIGALGKVEGGELMLEAMVAGLDGKPLYRASVAGLPDEAAPIGELLAERLLDMGARDILEMLRKGSC